MNLIVPFLLLIACVYGFFRAFAFVTDAIDHTLTTDMHPAKAALHWAVCGSAVIWCLFLIVFAGSLVLTITDQL